MVNTNNQSRSNSSALNDEDQSTIDQIIQNPASPFSTGTEIVETSTTLANKGNPGTNFPGDRNGGSEKAGDMYLGEDLTAENDTTSTPKSLELKGDMVHVATDDENTTTEVHLLQLEEEEKARSKDEDGNVEDDSSNIVAEDYDIGDNISDAGNADTATQTGVDFIGNENAGEGTAGNAGDWPADTGDDLTGRQDTTYSA